MNAQERSLFRQLSVFSGGCTLSAIEAVCGTQVLYDVLDLVGSLLDKSLLKQVPAPDGETRFSMLETILEYARWRLQESGQEEEARRLHAEYYLALAEASNPRIAGPEQKLWLDRFEREHDNLRSAMQWCRT